MDATVITVLNGTSCLCHWHVAALWCPSIIVAPPIVGATMTLGLTLGYRYTEIY